MSKEDILLKFKPEFEEHLSRQGFVLVDLRLARAGGKLVLEILADRQEGGITLDECSRLNRELGDLVDRLGLLFEAYSLEVSSPGLDRPLVCAGDFKRVLGRDLRIFLKEPVGDRIEYLGHLVSIDADHIEINTQQKTIKIPLGTINKAKQVIS
ncbi:MAG: hypothetical protein V1863_02770 [Candidatus Omnitrophota bacterium]